MRGDFRKATLLLVLFSTVFRVFLASQLEFGNDEVYYWLYAKYPDISHFDHPPMVGFFIQFFTLDLLFDSELAIRLAAILPASINMYLVFLIGKYLKNEKTGFIATVLYNLSIYGFIISGTFILPDAPLTFFWLLSFYFLVQVLPKNPLEVNRNKLLLGLFFIGCAMYSKYQAVYLLFGIGMYILIFNSKWLKEWRLYIGLIFPIIALGLIYYWNYQNDFISYKFHGNRVSFFSLKFNHNSFLREVLGQIVYNNPYIFVMIVIMLFAFFKQRFAFKRQITWLFLCCAIPLIFTTIYLSISRDTLPHWSGVSYLILLPLLAVFLSEKSNIHKKLVAYFSVLSLIMVLLTCVINYGWFLKAPVSKENQMLSRKDALMDMYGWKQASNKISNILKKEKLNRLPIISNRWYPAAHIDYYIARSSSMKVYGVGNLTDIHKYFWINKQYPDLTNEVLYITDSRNFKHPKDLYAEKYASITQVAEIPIQRSGVVVKYVYLYKLTNLECSFCIKTPKIYALY